MGQFKPMVKMETTEPSVELKLKKGGSVSDAKKMMNGGVMGALSQAPSPGARGGMAPAARPGKPSMMDRRKAMMGKPMMAKGGAMDALKAHADKPASKAHKGLKDGGAACATGGVMKSPKPGNYATGGVVNGQGGYKKGGDVKMASGGMPMAMKDGKKVPAFLAKKMADGGKACNTGGIIKSEKGKTMMHTAKVDTNSAPTGGVKNGAVGGYKKGGATKKHYATGGAVNNSGRAVAMPKKPVSQPVSNDRQSGTFKKGGEVGNASQKQLDAAYEGAIGPSKEDMDMAKTIRDIPGRLFRGAKRLVGMDDKPKAGSVTETEKSVTVAPAKKRGGSVKC